MRASAIVVAAGSGSRLGAAIPKAFLPLAGRTMLGITLQSLSRLSAFGEIVVAVPPGMESRARQEAAAVPVQLPLKVLAGGTERQDSVRAALALTSVEAELIVVHDAARPLATSAMFDACLTRAAAVGAAIIAIPLADTLKRVRKIDGDDRILATVPRAGLWQAQTPQAFRRNLLISAHAQALERGCIATDDADLVEQTGAAVAVVPGSPANLKITTIDDLRLAEALIATSPR
jgi:2-C-methyl-D-erythritol 4-phosphate cytidylyltransferase